MAAVSRLAAHEIIKVSRETFNKLSSKQYIGVSAIRKFFDSAQFNLSDADIKDVELAVVLIASAHKVSENHLDEARRLLNLCDFLSSYRGNSVQRVVHYFTKALQARIARAMGIIGQECKARKIFQPHEPTNGVNPALVSCCLQLPHIQLSHFVAIQAVIDSLASARKVHFIDLVIKGGEHCPVLMQALANRRENPVEFLKISAIGTPETKQRIEEIGEDIKDIVSAKDDERIFMDMKIEEWRVDLTEFGMVETEVGVSAFDQARILLNKFACAKPCLLTRNGKALVTGWKGTPFFSVSAWKFQLPQQSKGFFLQKKVK